MPVAAKLKVTPLKVFRTRRSLKSEDGTVIPRGVRVVALTPIRDGRTIVKLRVKIADKDHPGLVDLRLSAKPDVFATTKAGRPTAS